MPWWPAAAPQRCARGRGVLRQQAAPMAAVCRATVWGAACALQGEVLSATEDSYPTPAAGIFSSPHTVIVYNSWSNRYIAFNGKSSSAPDCCKPSLEDELFSYHLPILPLLRGSEALQWAARRPRPLISAGLLRQSESIQLKVQRP